MNTNTGNDKIKIYGIIKYIAGLIGFFGILIAILTVTGVTTWFLRDVIQYTSPFTDETKLVLSLTTSILGIFFLFIAFSTQIDKFFTKLETKRIKTDKKDETSGVSLETIFFLIIATILIVLAILLLTGTFEIQTDLPLLGKSTATVLIVSLVILALLAIITAFNRVLYQSFKEMKKVQWPTGKEMVDYSKKVFTFIIFFSIFFFALDLLLDFASTQLERLF